MYSNIYTRLKKVWAPRSNGPSAGALVALVQGRHCQPGPKLAYQNHVFWGLRVCLLGFAYLVWWLRHTTCALPCHSEAAIMNDEYIIYPHDTCQVSVIGRFNNLFNLSFTSISIESLIGL